MWAKSTPNLPTPPPAPKKKKKKIIRKTWSADQKEWKNECGLRLAQIWRVVTKANVRNKQRVTQTSRSHATQCVIGSPVWIEL